MITSNLYYISLLIWIAIAMIILPLLFKVTAPYGRHSQSNWGPMINNRIGWIIMELPALVVFVCFFLCGPQSHGVVSWIFFALWVGHYTNRVFVFPMRMKTKKKKMPVAIFAFAMIFNFCNGFFNGYYFGYLHHDYAITWLYDPRFILGCTLFITGMSINISSDEKLLHLRQSNAGGYKIPFGGLFEKVSCPNFFGEITEWIGYAIMVWGLAAASFAIWTAVNLIPRALDHHRLYRQNFDTYPSTRKAIFPYLL